jgi:UrcA family protein
MVMYENLLRVSLASGMALALIVGMGAAAMAKEVTVIKDRPDDAEVLTERVPYADLNLASAAGERTLIMRVRGAARRICAPQMDSHPYINCRGFAWRGAKPQIDRAVARARELASSGTSSIPPVAIVIAIPRCHLLLAAASAMGCGKQRPRS